VLRPEVVAVVGPMHYPLEGAVLISGHGAYRTPLGPVTLARETCRLLDDALRQELGAGLTPVRGDPEHSVEIELPFLQRALAEEWRLVPVMVRDQRREVARARVRDVGRRHGRHGPRRRLCGGRGDAERGVTGSASARTMRTP